MSDILQIPEELVTALLQWYPPHARDLPWRRDREPYHVWLSEIMLQQTRVEAVKGYYQRFLAQLPTIEALSQAPEAQVLKLWEGLGYYNRARNLQRAATQVMEQFGGVFPSHHADIVTLAGIGVYTAGAIGSICFELPTPAVDGNVLRVIARVLDLHESVDLPKVKAQITQALAAVYPQGQCGMFTQALMELGATVCIPNGAPHCGECPLYHLCKGHARQTAAQLPVRKEKKARVHSQMTVFVFLCEDTAAIDKRPPHGLLAGLWQFPNEPGTLTPEEAIHAAEKYGVQPTLLLKSVERTHVFTHREWEMTCYFFRCKQQVPDLTWANAKAMQNTYALATAFRTFYDAFPDDFWPTNPTDSANTAAGTA